MMGAKPNRITLCPQCGGKLSADKKPDTNSWSGVVYRRRFCPECRVRIHTKQGPEEITGVEKPGA